MLVDSPHERAWRDSLRQLMEGDWSDVRPATSYAPERFTHAFYQEVMAGKPDPTIFLTAADELGLPAESCEGRVEPR